MPIQKQKGTLQITYRGCCLGCYKDREEGDRIYWWFKEMAEKEGWDLATIKEKAEKVKRGVPLDAKFMTAKEVVEYLGITIHILHQTKFLSSDKYLYRRRNKNRDLSFKAEEIKKLREEIKNLKNTCKLIEEEGVAPVYYINEKGEIFSFNKTSFPKKLKYMPNQDGYPQVYLCYTKEYSEKTGKRHGRFAVHRLVATYFIPNPNNYEVVNHKDGNKKNYSSSNLEWCTQEDNYLHALKNGFIGINHSISNSGKKGVIYRPKQRKWEVTFQGKLIGYFDDLEEAIKAREVKEKEVYGFIIPKYSDDVPAEKTKEDNKELKIERLYEV